MMVQLRGIHFLVSMTSRPDPFDFILCNPTKDEVYVLPFPVTLKNLKDQIPTATTD
jgi:hypothetical protein